MHAFVNALQAVGSPPYIPLLGLSDIFLLFFIMLGPIKVIGPFAAQTRNLEPAASRTMAWKVFWLSTITVVAVALVGAGMLSKWRIPPEVLQLAGGLIFLLVALQMVMAQYKAPEPVDAQGPPVMHLVFPVTVTPYGIAAIIVLMALSGTMERSIAVLALALAVMVLNLLTMLFARGILGLITMVPLRVLGAVLGVLQVALALQLIISSVHQGHFFGVD